MHEFRHKLQKCSNQNCTNPLHREKFLHSSRLDSAAEPSREECETNARTFLCDSPHLFNYLSSLFHILLSSEFFSSIFKSKVKHDTYVIFTDWQRNSQKEMHSMRNSSSNSIASSLHCFCTWNLIAVSRVYDNSCNYFENRLISRWLKILPFAQFVHPTNLQKYCIDQIVDESKRHRDSSETQEVHEINGHFLIDINDASAHNL